MVAFCGPLAPLLGEIEICIQWVFYRKFNFGQLLFKAFFDIIKSFGRNQVKFSKNFENPYFCSKNPYFRENPYANPYAFKKSVYVRIHLYVWQNCICIDMEKKEYQHHYELHFVVSIRLSLFLEEIECDKKKSYSVKN